jgi:hypothetical protein
VSMAARENPAAVAESRSSELRRAAGQLTVASAVRNRRYRGYEPIT